MAQGGPMCFFFSFMPATCFLVVGYFVLFSSMKAEGVVKKFGQVLAVWLFVIATIIPVAGAYITISDMCPLEQIFEVVQTK
jgi:uncharacterized membrane protein